MTSATKIFGDWGSTRFRLWQIHDGKVTGSVELPGLLAQQGEPRAVLHTALAKLGGNTGRVLVCGMAGARGGLAQVPYLPCPATPEDIAQAVARIDIDGCEVAIVPGLSFSAPDGYCDVMRGEETQVIGAADLCGGEDATFILPGTHAKWVAWRNGRMVQFATAMTGEMNALLASSSLLDGPLAPSSTIDEDGFAEGLARNDEDLPLTALLFAARSMRMTGQRSDEWARGYISGLLIGHEVARMLRLRWIAQNPPVLVAAGQLARCYEQALARFGAKARLLDPERCAIVGLERIDALT
ncbi:MAG: hypothetical protein B7Y88_01365 [Sphingomonadales bacterium 32-64-17]|nr:MAG: hypothetical protein B7Y88_01365 [Sphingomonadales bacterium 32-64-17]